MTSSVLVLQASVARQNRIKSQDIGRLDSDGIDSSQGQEASPSVFPQIEFQETTSDQLTFRNWNDFKDHQLIIGAKSSNGFYFTAVDDNAKPEEEFTDRWFLVLRDGLYTAQVEQSMAVIYRLFLGYAPEVQIIKDVRNENDINVREMQRYYINRNNEPKYYIASRGIKDFITWNQYGKEKHGNLKIVGLGELLAIAEFFGESDLNGNNFGFKITKNSLISYKIDNAYALRFECLDALLDQNSINQLPACMDVPPIFSEFVGKNEILNEKRQMLQKIANTDFHIIESIFRRYITSDYIESMMWNLTFILNMQREKGIANIKQDILKQEILNLNHKEYDIDAIIDKIKRRHLTLQAIFENKLPNENVKYKK